MRLSARAIILMNNIDIAIIGAGPAGIAVAIQLIRYGFNPVIFEKAGIGGLLFNASLVENYPGFPDGISGIDLASLMAKQLSRFKPAIIYQNVRELDFSDELFIFKTSTETYCAHKVVIASGTVPVIFSDVEYSQLRENKVFYEIFPIITEKKRNIAIIGAGDAAFDYALNLSRHNSIAIFNRGEKRSCLPLLAAKVDAASNIEYNHSARLISIDSDTAGKLKLKFSAPSGLVDYSADYLVLAIGRKPNLNFLTAGLAKKTPYLEADGRLFFIGDVKNGMFRQTSIAVGDGVFAAMRIFALTKEYNG